MPVRSVAWAFLVICSGSVTLSAALAQSSTPPVAAQSLKSPAEFESIGDKAARSRAMFTEITKVLTHPRCMNCHPAGANPTQGSDRHEHMPPVWREDAASGAIGTTCSACHHDENFAVTEATTYKNIPGHPRWGLAPLSMAWQGKSIGDICRQVKDVNLNGGRDLSCCRSTSPRTTSSLGAGIRDRAANPRRAVRRPPANWFRPGSIPERSAL